MLVGDRINNIILASSPTTIALHLTNNYTRQVEVTMYAFQGDCYECIESSEGW